MKKIVLLMAILPFMGTSVFAGKGNKVQSHMEEIQQKTESIKKMIKNPQMQEMISDIHTRAKKVQDPQRHREHLVVIEEKAEKLKGKTQNRRMRKMLDDIKKAAERVREMEQPMHTM